MTRPDRFEHHVLHTCEECMNVYLLDPAAGPFDCDRDKTRLDPHSTAKTDIWLKFYTAVCDACGRLTKIPCDSALQCVLCDCPTRTELPHEPN